MGLQCDCDDVRCLFFELSLVQLIRAYGRPECEVALWLSWHLDDVGLLHLPANPVRGEREIHTQIEQDDSPHTFFPLIAYYNNYHTVRKLARRQYLLQIYQVIIRHVSVI